MTGAETFGLVRAGDPIARHVAGVRVNGREIQTRDCFVANDRAGYVGVFCRDADGFHLVTHPQTGERAIPRQYIFGDVEIVLRAEHDRS